MLAFSSSCAQIFVQIPDLDPNDPRIQAAVDQVGGAAKKDDANDKKEGDDKK